jgi:molybdate transport system substrate-binding protein
MFLIQQFVKTSHALKLTVFSSLLTLLILLSGCDHPSIDEPQTAPPLKVFSGITMVQPLQKVATEFTKRTGIAVEIQQGATGLLYKTLVTDRQGDVFFPGSERLRLRDQSHPDNIFAEHVFVGYNRLAMMVAKGNPRQLTNDLNQLTDPNLSVVLATVNSGTIGQESKKMLDSLGLTTAVYDNVTYFTTDSHRLASAIQQKHADVILNWYAAGQWAQSKDSMDVIALDPNIAQLKRLEISVLTFSKQPQIAKHFLAFARSEFGLRTFAEYGFLTADELQHELSILHSAAPLLHTPDTQRERTANAN